MPSKSPEPFRSRPLPLAERVQERVDAVAAKLTAHERRQQRGTAFIRAPEGDNSLSRQALRRVFRDMGRNQRTARRQAGQAPSPVVRQAALAFRQNPSLPALVLVAASLDDVGLLFW